MAKYATKGKMRICVWCEAYFLESIMRVQEDIYDNCTLIGDHCPHCDKRLKYVNFGTSELSYEADEQIEELRMRMNSRPVYHYGETLTEIPYYG